MPSLAEAAVSRTSNFTLFKIDRNDFDARRGQKSVEITNALCAESRLDDDRYFQESSDRKKSRVCLLDLADKYLLFRFASQDRNQCRRASITINVADRPRRNRGSRRECDRRAPADWHSDWQFPRVPPPAGVWRAPFGRV